MKESTNRTDVTRTWAMWTFMFTVLAATVGWAFGFDLEMYKPVLTAAVAVLGAGELSNVGKRATSKPEVIDAHARAMNGAPPE